MTPAAPAQAAGGGPPLPGPRLYHTTSHKAALNILRQGAFKTPHQISPDYASEVYGDTPDAHKVYTSTNRQASLNNAVSTGVTFEIDPTGHEHKILHEPHMEGGLAMVHGGLPAGTIRGVKFAGEHYDNAEIQRLVSRLNRSTQ